LAYDETYKKQALGVVLTDFMIAHVLDHDHVAQLDFGFGEDEYKESWMKESRYYSGYMAFNPRTIRGFYYGIKHIAGQPLKRGIKWLLRLVAKPQRTV
jgi:CelD/BcsL family acetyltransferase involved in cellulose biosynthesis